MEEDSISREEKDPHFKWAANKKRIQMTHCVAEAFKLLREQHAGMITKSFLDVGLSLPLTEAKTTCLFPTASLKSGTIPRLAEIEAYQQAHVKIPEIGENGEYILEDGNPLRQYGILNYERFIYLSHSMYSCLSCTGIRWYSA